MIKQVSHPAAGTGPAGFTLALEVAYELHPPVTRAPEVASVTVARRGVSTARSRRRSPARG
ncbi:hypothetical protein [Streptomyces canus]|uniref:Uncharacterized protein n=1 Tax=Streptomyces canus TaxID=58343 RepID=A0AAW8FID4_9ACTN|nr:hypothetical protein [Streptomyces canus]MDQ0761857.1 hypothetical protein [Streptomyces canus]MDQ0909549.1 hypothetical protein [Streptomyces canus]MDQ1069563.1 hypothetical protein [Streptomyces canus]